MAKLVFQNDTLASLELETCAIVRHVPAQYIYINKYRRGEKSSRVGMPIASVFPDPWSLRAIFLRESKRNDGEVATWAVKSH